MCTKGGDALNVDMDDKVCIQNKLKVAPLLYIYTRDCFCEKGRNACFFSRFQFFDFLEV